MERIEILGVGVDVLKKEEFESVILDMVNREGTKQIIFLSLKDLLKARKKGEFRECVKNAALVIPTSLSIIKAAVFLKKIKPVRYNPFSFLIDMLSVLESRLKSLYILGGGREALLRAEKNIRLTFPSLRIVGRATKKHAKKDEENVIKAIQKASPTLILASEGIRTKNLWMQKKIHSLNTTFLYYEDAVPIISKRKKRQSDDAFQKGHVIIPTLLKNPFSIFFIFPYTWYLLSLLFERMKINAGLKKNENNTEH